MKNILLIVVALVSIVCNAQRDTFENISEKNGKIGIGTNNPDELLTVKGKIHTQEVLVDLQGAVAPDYVFEWYAQGTSTLKSEYQLLPLPALEEFILEHKHLPKVPSAETLEKEGMSLKEMNLLLLEKVEELTLYTLKQQKEIDGLKEKLLELGE
ncbi:tail fiber protein [Marinirhabdus gelatinilytica]|nr:tail fiber protein [Marinirhabdus gelatinilytica]